MTQKENIINSFFSINSTKLSAPSCNFKLKRSHIVIASLAINILSLALPIMVLQVYDRILVNNSIGTLSILLSGVVFVLVLETILRIARSYITAWAGIVYEYTLTCNSMRYFLHGDMTHMDERSAGEHLQDISSFAKLRDFYGGQALTTIIDIPFAFIFLGIIWYLAGNLVLVPIVVIILFLVIAWFTGHNLRKNLEIQNDCDDKRYNFMIETLNGIHTIKTHGIESIFQRRYEYMEEQSSIANYNTAILSTKAYNLGITFNEVMVISIVTVGAPMVMNGFFTTGTLIAGILLAGRLMQPIQKALALWTSYQDYSIAKDKANDIFAIPQVTKNIKYNSEEIKREGSLEISNLIFGYNNETIFEGADLSLQYGDTVSISGDHNSGKTTLIKLIAGCYNTNEGSIKIDGINATTYMAEDLIKHVGVLSDEGIVFNGTIIDNITGFNPEYKEQAIEITKLLNIHHNITILPSGYETVLNNSAANPISPGLEQMISIARVLIHKPRLILFDNADRSLDRSSYNDLIRLLNRLKGKATMVLISGDRNIIRLADTEYMISEKKIEKVNVNDSKHHDVKPFQELRI